MLTQKELNEEIIVSGFLYTMIFVKDWKKSTIDTIEF